MTSADGVRTLRFAAGTTLAAAFAFGLETPLAVLTPVLTSVFLGGPAPRPGLRMMLGVVAAALIGLGLGVASSLLLLGSPLLLLLAVGLLLFRIYLAAAGGSPAFLVLMLLIGVLLVPIVGTVSTQTALDFAGDFIVALLLALVWIQVGHALFPDAVTASALAPSTPEPALPPPAAARLAYALQRTAIFLPAFGLVVALQMTGQLQALLYAAILSLGAQPGSGFKASLPMLGGAILGGGFAVAIYLLTSMVHQFPLLILLIAFSLLVIGRGQFTGGPAAPYWASARSAMLILVSSSDSLFGDETGDKFLTRVTSIVVAGALVGIGLQVTAGLGRPRELASRRPASA